MRGYLSVRKRNATLRLPLSDVNYIQRQNRRIFVYKKTGSIYFYDQIDNVERELDHRFFRMLNGCFINMEHLKEVKDQCAYFDNGATLYISRASQTRLKHAYYNFLKNSSCL